MAHKSEIQWIKKQNDVSEKSRGRGEEEESEGGDVRLEIEATRMRLPGNNENEMHQEKKLYEIIVTDAQQGVHARRRIFQI